MAMTWLNKVQGAPEGRSLSYPCRVQTKGFGHPKPYPCWLCAQVSGERNREQLASPLNPLGISPPPSPTSPRPAQSVSART